MSTLKSALGFWLTFVKAMGLSIAITFASGLIGVVYGGLFFPFDVTEEAFANRLADGTTAAFLGLMVMVTQRMLRSVPRGFHRIERPLLVSTLLAWVLARVAVSNEVLIIELLIIGCAIPWIILVRPRHHSEAPS
jgi:ABC-type amino acid transport system permease subunit